MIHCICILSQYIQNKEKKRKNPSLKIERLTVRSHDFLDRVKTSRSREWSNSTQRKKFSANFRPRLFLSSAKLFKFLDFSLWWLKTGGWLQNRVKFLINAYKRSILREKTLQKGSKKARLLIPKRFFLEKFLKFF